VELIVLLLEALLTECFHGASQHKFVNFTYGEISVSSVQDICSLLSLKDGDVIADLGCGTGGVLLSCGHFARKNCIELGTMIGIDLMGSYVEEGRRACEFAKVREWWDGGGRGQVGGVDYERPIR